MFYLFQNDKERLITVAKCGQYEAVKRLCSQLNDEDINHQNKVIEVN